MAFASRGRAGSGAADLRFVFFRSAPTWRTTPCRSAPVDKWCQSGRTRRMFVRWRRRPSGRLSARLVHNQRVAGRVRQRHVGELGAISVVALDVADEIEGIAARKAFWRTANAAVARVAGPIDGSTTAEHDLRSAAPLPARPREAKAFSAAARWP